MALLLEHMYSIYIDIDAADIEKNEQEVIKVNDINDDTNEMEYDMERGGKQFFTIKEKDGEESEIIIEEIPENERVANGTYKITRTVKGESCGKHAFFNQFFQS